MGYANGRIPSHALGDVPGNNAGLIKAAAYRWKACHYEAVRRGLTPLNLTDGSVGRTYRSYARQLLAKRVYGSNAATPGYSNHGWGLAVDLMSQGQRNTIDRIGSKYGLAKRWSDASWEWWHIKTNLGVGSAGHIPKPKPPSPLRNLTKWERNAAQRLLYHRRKRNKEARSGKGPRWREQNKWVGYWKSQIERQMHNLKRDSHKRGAGGWARNKRGARYQILKRVVKAQSGNL